LGTPDYYDLYSITSKSVTGPGLVPRQWTYDYGDLGPGRTTLPMPCTTCPSVKTVTVNQPDGSKQRHRFGILYGVNEGRLLGVDSVDSTGTVVRSERSEYVTDSEASTLPFPDQYGVTSAGVSDIVSLRIRPIKKTTIVQDGITYTSEVSMCNGVYCFDGFARPTQFNKFSVAGSKLDSTTYHDNTNLWVLSQVASQATNGIVSNRTDFDSATALPIRSYSFDRLLQTLSYYSNGTLHTVKDPRNHVTTLSGWKRGIPQLVQYPDATSQSVVVDDSGWIRSLTEENGFTTTYDYDLMGRLKEIVHPVGGQAWEKTSFTFEPEASSVYGIEAGHWKHTATTGNARKTTHYDALWQPVVEERVEPVNYAFPNRQALRR
jgi:YD repeat-containing protein